MANQSPSSLFLDQGQGFWGALKERYPWLTPAQIQALLPQVQAMNPNITDIGIGYPGEPYNIPYIPKPPGYIREYGEPEDVRAYGEQEAGAMRAFLPDRSSHICLGWGRLRSCQRASSGSKWWLHRHL